MRIGLLSKPEFVKALKDFYRSLESKPFMSYEANIHYHLGISHANLEMFEKAISPLTKAMEL